MAEYRVPRGATWDDIEREGVRRLHTGEPGIHKIVADRDDYGRLSIQRQMLPVQSLEHAWQPSLVCAPQDTGKEE